MFDGLEHPVAILAPDSPYPFIYCNDAFCRFCGLDRSELIGHNPDFYFTHDEPAAIPQISVDPMMATNVLRKFHRDGHTIWTVTHIEPIWDNGVKLGYLRMPRDVTHLVNELANDVIQTTDTVRSVLRDLRQQLCQT